MSDYQGRIYEDLRTVFNGVFKFAQSENIISKNPVNMVLFLPAERKNRRSLTSKEVSIFLSAIETKEAAKYKQSLLAMLYFGFRPCELSTARVEGNFIISRNAKRKNKKIEYKKIPISEKIRDKFDFSKGFSAPGSTEAQNRFFKKIFKDKTITQYCLRHTFATECAKTVRPDVVEIWMGDSPERLVGKVYIHFPDEFMQEQMQKVEFTFD